MSCRRKQCRINHGADGARAERPPAIGAPGRYIYFLLDNVFVGDPTVTAPTRPLPTHVLSIMIIRIL